MASTLKLRLAEFASQAAAATGATAGPKLEIAIDLIDVRRQVRTDLGSLDELKESIAEKGVEVAIIVNAQPDGRFLLVAGERRLRASIMAGKRTIPADVRRGLTELQMRALQVLENNEREPMSPYDQAVGVAEDVYLYGIDGAAAIWRKSAAWISKRAGVTRYAAPVVTLLREGVTGDPELLLSLNQLYELSPDDFARMVDGVRTSRVGRDDVRNKVARLRQWRAEQAEKAASVDADSPSGDDEAAQTRGSAAADAVGPAAGRAEALQASRAEDKRRGSKRRQDADASAGEGSPRPDAKALERGRAKLDALRAELMEDGQARGLQVGDLGGHIRQLQMQRQDGEWVLWSAFLDTVLPVLEVLGPDRAKGYMTQLQLDLRRRDAQTIWQDLHPVSPGEESNGVAARRVAPARPEGWDF